MDFLVKIIFDEIEVSEEKAINTYKKITKKIKNKDQIKIINSIIDDEISHKNYFDNFKNSNQIKEDSVKKIKNWMQENSAGSSNSENLIEILNGCIKEEEIAMKCYLELSENLEGSAKQELIEIANQEQKHSELLKEIIKSISI